MPVLVISLSFHALIEHWLYILKAIILNCLLLILMPQTKGNSQIIGSYIIQANLGSSYITSKKKINFSHMSRMKIVIMDDTLTSPCVAEIGKSSGSEQSEGRWQAAEQATSKVPLPVTNLPFSQ